MKPIDIIRECATEYGVEVIDMLAFSRKRHICDARNTAFLLIREKFGEMLNLHEIGKLLNRNHVTVINQSRQAKNLMLDRTFKANYDAIIQKLKFNESIQNNHAKECFHF